MVLIPEINEAPRRFDHNRISPALSNDAVPGPAEPTRGTGYSKLELLSRRGPFGAVARYGVAFTGCVAGALMLANRCNAAIHFDPLAPEKGP